MNLHIEQWNGRLGNNIVQLKNTIQVALFYNYNIIIPDLTNPYGQQVSKYSYFSLNNNITIEDDKITDDGNFYYAAKTQLKRRKENLVSEIDKNLFKMNKNKTIEILKDSIVIPKPLSLNENDLVIHIRSGDIFEDDGTHPAYIMPPLSYYVDIIENNNFNNIWIIAEDRKNPCIDELLTLYPKANYRQQSLDEDIKILLGATHVVMSYGTMVHALLLFSDSIKNLYSPSYFTGSALYEEMYIQNDGQSRINNFKIELDEYHKKLTPWKNTKGQREIMMAY